MELTNKQKKVMAELFEGTEDEDVILDNNHVSRRKFDLWLDSEEWNAEFEIRIKKNQRQAQIIISNYQPVAAAKLIQLTQCEKEQTARQSCLDLLQMERVLQEKEINSETFNPLNLSDETSNEIVKLLAKDARKKNQG